jgi:hypothetical protein
MEIKHGSKRQAETQKEKQAELDAQQAAERKKAYLEVVANIKNYNKDVESKEKFEYCTPVNGNIVVQLYMIPEGAYTGKRPFVGVNGVDKQKLFRNLQPFETFGVVKSVSKNSTYDVGDLVSLSEMVVNKIGSPQEQMLQYQLFMFDQPLYGYVIFPEHMIQSIIHDKITFEDVEVIEE